MQRSNWQFHLAWILTLAASGCVVVPVPHSGPAPRQAPPPPREVIVVTSPHAPAEDPRIAQCRRDNYQEHAQAMQIYHRAQQAGNISPGEAQRFAESDQHLRRYASQLGRDGLSLAECEAIGRQIAEEQRMVSRMAASRPGYAPYRGDPALMQCRADVQRTQADTTRLYHRAQASGEISPQEARQFAEMDQRMTRLAQSVARDGLLLRECEFLLRESNQDREQVERMASNRRGGEAPEHERGRPDRPGAPVPAPGLSQQQPAHVPREALAQCAASNHKIREETRRQYTRAQAAGAITPGEEELFEKTEQRLDKKSQELSRNGLTLPECEALANEVAEQHKRVERLAGAWPRVPSR